MAFDDKENKVERGTKLRIKASTFNEIQDAVKAFKRREFELKGQRPSSLIRSNLDVLVYNSIGSDLTQPFQVVKIKQPLLDISEDVLNANTRPTFIAIEPTDTFDAVGITQVPIQDGEIDRAIINGITIVKVKFTAIDHTWANPVDGVTDYLESAELGQARILMDLGSAAGGLTESGDTLDSGEESGTGSGLIGDIRWCMVNLIGAIFASEESSGVAGNPFVVQLSETTGPASGQPKTLTSLGAWTNDGTALSNVLTAMQIEGSAIPVNPAATVVAWYSKQTGKYEYLPIQYASDVYPGLVSIANQTFLGLKTFFSGVCIIGNTINGLNLYDLADDIDGNNTISVHAGNKTVYFGPRHYDGAGGFGSPSGLFSIQVHGVAYAEYFTAGWNGAGRGGFDPNYTIAPTLTGMRCDVTSNHWSFEEIGGVDTFKLGSGRFGVGTNYGITTTRTVKDGAGNNKLVTITGGLITDWAT